MIKYLLFISLTFFCFISSAKVNAKKGIALDGTDVVAYFDKDQTKAVKGKNDFSHTHQGIKYLFSSEENLEKFKASPENYLPAYGGYCAWAVEESSEYVPVDYDSFIIDSDAEGNQRLLLFYNRFFINTKTKWTKKASNIKGGGKKLIRIADTNWEKMLSSPSK